LLHEIYTDEDAFHREHRSAPHYKAWQQVAARCVITGSHVNTFCRPLFPDDIAQRGRLTEPTREGTR
jgi:hypothetical protein